MIATGRRLVQNESHLGQEVTIRCTIRSDPRVGSRGGKKTLYEIRAPDTKYQDSSFLSIWHEDPSWSDEFGQTAPYIQDLLDKLPLQEGETVLARGIPNIYREKWYFNVTSVLIRDPDTCIGKSEMRSADECPRIYNLSFQKNVYSPGRYSLSVGSIKGRIAHELLEYAIGEPEYRGNFQTGWTESEIDECLTEVIENEYKIELALCRLAWVSTNRIKSQAQEAIVPLLSDEQFSEMVSDADDVSTEVTLSRSLGFNGRVDILMDGVPFDLKTTYNLSERKRQRDRFQLRIYLLALTLESLEPGETFEERLAGGIEGYLVYPNLASTDSVEIEDVELREQDIKSILQLRNEAAVLREGFGIPTTYGRNCAGCGFKEPTELADGGTTSAQLPPPCQFYCQSERRWDCFETNDQGAVITQCPLFDECDQRLEFRDPQVTDHYNQLRNALNAERDARRELGTELDHLENAVLIETGLLIPDLSLRSLEGQRRLNFESERKVVPAFSPGDEIRLQHAESDYYQTATYHGRSDGNYVFQLDSSPTPAFLDPTETFEARRTIAIDTLPRSLLRQLDYAQRAEVSPLLETVGAAGDTLVTVPTDDLGAILEYLDNKELYINIPVRTDRDSTLASLVDELCASQLSVPGSGADIPPEEQRILVLSSAPTITDVIAERLSSNDGFVRMDGFGGREMSTISPTMEGHEIYTELRDSSVILSSTDYALSENVFHAMRTGDRDVRPHSERFFDAVILTGAEKLTEPQFYFLQVLGDRIYAIGDAQGAGPEMVSGEAQESGLSESYFNRLYRRFSNVENPDSRSFVIPAVMTSVMADLFTDLDVPISSSSGGVEFVDASGTTTSAIGNTTLEYQFPCDTSESRFIRLEPVDDVDAPQIASAFDRLRGLDAQEFTVREIYTIQDVQFRIRTSNPIDGEYHHVKVQIPPHATPYLNKLLTHNPDEARAVAEVCEERNPDAVVTPFVAHANTLRDELDEIGIHEIPVYHPGDLNGEHLDSTVVSFGVSDERRMVTPPVNNIQTLYALLNSGKRVTIVGDRETLSRNSILKELI